MTSEEFKDPLSFRTLLRYKLLIVVVAMVIILGGYLRIVTQRPRYTGVARMRVRFSQELLNAPQVQSGSVRTPVLEEEVKSYLVLLRDPTFIDQVISGLPRPTEAPTAPEDELEETSAYGVLVNQAIDLVEQVKSGLGSFLDTILFVKDTIVSNREQRVLSTLSRLSVEQGTDASHVITVSYTATSAEGAANIANEVTFQFIKQQKDRTRPRDVNRLQSEVDDAKKYLEDVNRRRFGLAMTLGYPSIEEAITRQSETLEQLRLTENALRAGLALLELGVIPSNKALPIQTMGSDREAERAIMDQLMTVLMDESFQIENAQLYATLQDKLEKSRAEMKAVRVQSMRTELQALLDQAVSERERLSADDRVVKFSPHYSALLVDEKTAQTRLSQAAEKLQAAIQFNQQLDDEYTAQNVALLSKAKEPPFPDQERRLLKLVVIIVLGVAAGFGAATARHIVWPKPPRNRPGTYAGSLGDLDVPIIVLPDESEDNLESDLEFDMTFPEEKGSAREA